MSNVFKELKGLWVSVDKIIYVPDAQTSPDRPFAFAYFLSIHNDSEITVTIKGRKWVVDEFDGHFLVVEGDGVVGETPVLDPGEHFSYNSFHTLPRSVGEAEGAYFGVDSHGDWIFTRIPKFRMCIN